MSHGTLIPDTALLHQSVQRANWASWAVGGKCTGGDLKASLVVGSFSGSQSFPVSYAQLQSSNLPRQVPIEPRALCPPRPSSAIFPPHPKALTHLGFHPSQKRCRYRSDGPVMGFNKLFGVLYSQEKNGSDPTWIRDPVGLLGKREIIQT